MEVLDELVQDPETIGGAQVNSDAFGWSEQSTISGVKVVPRGTGVLSLALHRAPSAQPVHLLHKQAET